MREVWRSDEERTASSQCARGLIAYDVYRHQAGGPIRISRCLVAVQHSPGAILQLQNTVAVEKAGG